MNTSNIGQPCEFNSWSVIIGDSPKRSICRKEYQEILTDVHFTSTDFRDRCWKVVKDPNTARNASPRRRRAEQLQRRGGRVWYDTSGCRPYADNFLLRRSRVKAHVGGYERILMGAEVFKTLSCASESRLGRVAVDHACCSQLDLVLKASCSINQLPKEPTSLLAT